MLYPLNELIYKFLSLQIIMKTDYQFERRQIFSPQQQEKILLGIINLECARQLIPMVQSGYRLTPIVLETLKWSGQKDLIFALMNVKFDFDGDSRWLFSFLCDLFGEKNTAAMVVQKSQKDNYQSCWKTMYSLLSTEQLEENEQWEELAKKGKWEILARHKRFDDIICNPSNRYSSDAAKILTENNQLPRIIELKKFQWLTQISGGEEILWRHKQYAVLFTHRDSLRRWSEADVIRKLCSIPEGQNFLYRIKEYQILVGAGCFDPFWQNENWNTLACLECYRAIDWNRWLQKEKNSDFETRKIYRFAVKAKQWQFLADHRQYRLLLKKGRLFYCCKQLFARTTVGKRK